MLDIKEGLAYVGSKLLGAAIVIVLLVLVVGVGVGFILAK